MSTTVTPLAASISAGTTWKSDAGHSSVGFRVKHFGIAWMKGGFDDFSAQLEAAADGSMRLTGSSPVESIRLGSSDQLRGHLLSPDFFDVQLHPEISFESSSVALDADGSVKVDGSITINGITRPITLAGTWTGPITDPYGGERIGLEIAGELNRFDVGVMWSAQLADGTEIVAPTVRLEGAFELVRS